MNAFKDLLELQTISAIISRAHQLIKDALELFHESGRLKMTFYDILDMMKEVEQESENNES